MLPVVTDPDERNALVWGTWSAHRGQNPAEVQAVKKFTTDRFERSNGHCQFIEHEAIGADGQPRKYTLTDLVKIARLHNKEARTIGAFPPIASHHTPNKGDTDAKDPDVIGYGGNHRLGMIDSENPRWAIFADEFHMPEHKPLLRSKPFRSVELWTFKDGRMRFHPVAAVGADAPRLQMPAKYTQGQFETINLDGAVVEKYTVAAYVGGSNTFVKEPVKYAAEGNPDMNDQESAKLMAMLAETPQFKFLTRLMEEFEAEQATAQQPAPGAAQIPGAAPTPEPSPAPSPSPVAAQPAADGLDDLDDLLAPEPTPATPVPPPADKPPEKNTVTANNPAVVSVEKYNALHDSHQRLIKVTEQQHQRLATIEKGATDTIRKGKITELASKYPMMVDSEEESKVCLYSLGSQMSDDQFNAHVATVEKYAQRVADSPMIPRGALPERYVPQSDVEKYEQRLAEEAIKVHGEAAKQGKQLDYAACEAEAKRRIGK